MSNTDGGPAFPTTSREISPSGAGHTMQTIIQRGMTLRDYFAACAMQGMYAGHAVNTFGESGRYAEAAYQIADAMLEERCQVSATYRVTIGGQLFGLDAELRDDAGSSEFFTWTDQIPNCPKCREPLEDVKCHVNIHHIGRGEQCVECDACGWQSEAL